jgi:hypothetical protein
VIHQGHDQPRQLGAHAPRSHARPGDACGHKHESSDLCSQQCAVRRVVGQKAALSAVQGARPKQCDGHRGWQQDGDLHTPTSPGRARHAEEREHDERGRPHSRDKQPRVPEVVYHLRVRAQEQVVGGAVEAALLDGVEEKRVAGAEHQQAVGIGQGEHGPLGLAR